MRSSRVIDLRKKRAGQHLPLPLPPTPSKRASPLRARRRRVRALVALGVVVAVGILAYGVSWASYLPRFSIQTVSVSGAKDVRSTLIESYVDTQLFDGSYRFLSRANIFLFPRADIEKAVVSYFPRISSAKISRASLLAQTIQIAVEERQPYARWCPSTLLGTGDTNSCYLMDESGFVFASATTSPGIATPYVFTGTIATSSVPSKVYYAPPIGETFLPGHLAGMLALLTRLGQAGFPVQGVAVEGDQDFSVHLSQGFDIRASFGEDINAVVKNLQLVLSSNPLNGKASELQYIDLRFGNRVYYKLKGEAEATSTAQ